MSNPFADIVPPGEGLSNPSSGSASADRGGGGESDLLAMVRRSLRGRYMAAGLLGLGLAVPLAGAGWTIPEVQWAASVVIEVLEAPRTVIYSADAVTTDNERIEQYIGRQISDIKGQRVLEIAVDDPRLREAGWPAGNDGVKALRDAIDIRYVRRDPTFMVRFVDPDRLTAELGLMSVRDAYDRLNKESNSTEARERALDDNIRSIDSEIKNLEQSIQAALADVGTNNLQPQIKRLDDLSFESQLRIDALEDAIELREASQTPGQEVTQPAQMSTEQLAEQAQDRELLGLLSQKQTVEAELSMQSGKYGPRHPLIKRLSDEVSVLGLRIIERERLVREQMTRLAGIDPGLDVSLDELRLQLKAARESKAGVDRDLRKLNQILQTTRRESDDLELKREQRKNFVIQKNQLEVERQNLIAGRVNIAPLTPAAVDDDKRKTFAAAGFVFGGGLGVSLVAAYGMFRRSYRYIDDVDDPSRMPPLLGTLPELDRKDPDTERIAAVSVHNLRNTLHAVTGYTDQQCRVIACTSAEPGDGKTTLVQSLGASYALTGLRTIIVDLDLVGAGLSARMGMSNRRGVTDLLGGLEPTKCIKRTATEKLYVMPAGDREAFKPEQLAHRPVQQIIDWLRERFDVVIMDTGPVMGSLEAGLSVSVADQTLLVVPRGQPDRIGKAAVTRLQRLGVKNLGLVFNRAETVDLRQSLSAASVGAPSLQPTAQRPPMMERRLDEDASIVGSIPPPSAGPSTGKRAEDGTGR